MQDILRMTVTELATALRDKTLSSQEAIKAYLKNIEALEPKIGAYITITADQALQQAAAIDELRMRKEQLSPLAGIPIGLKDNLCTKGIRTTCGSRMLEQYIPPYDATVVGKLLDQGVIPLGKLNMDEFAMGSSTENSAFHITRNPADVTRVPGGSSGGSAAAVAAGEAPWTLGSDTGGSIRQPAAFCGVVGMKPTYGAVSRYGLVAFASSLDQIGPLTRTVRDNALLLTAISGHDPKDATSVEREYGNYADDLQKGVNGMKIALPVEFTGEGIDQQVRDAVLAAAKQYEAMGATIVEVSMPALAQALPAYYVISSAEASSNLARFDGVRYGYRTEQYEDMTDLYQRSRSESMGPEVKRRIMLGTFALSAGYYDAYYKQALRVRSLIVSDYNRVLADCHAILSPVAPTTAYHLGEKTSDPLTMYMGDICTVPVNIAGLPALSLPCGTDDCGLPIAMQLTGRAFDEAMLYRLGYAYEYGREV